MVRVVLGMLAVAPLACGRERASNDTIANTQFSAGEIAFHATMSNPPDHFSVQPPCTQESPTPKSGVCAGTQWGEGRIEGGIEGTVVYQDSWVALPTGDADMAAVAIVTGSVKGCGSGSFSYRHAGPTTAAGVYHADAEVLPGFGSGELAHRTGHWRETGKVEPDYSFTGEMSGRLRCDMQLP